MLLYLTDINDFVNVLVPARGWFFIAWLNYNKAWIKCWNLYKLGGKNATTAILQRYYVICLQGTLILKNVFVQMLVREWGRQLVRIHFVPSPARFCRKGALNPTVRGRNLFLCLHNCVWGSAKHQFLSEAKTSSWIYIWRLLTEG